MIERPLKDGVGAEGASERLTGSAAANPTSRKAWWSEDEPTASEPVKTLNIMDDDQGPRWSGLYDHRGRKLFHQPQPFGFRR